MTHATKRTPRLAAISAASLAAVLLAGCSTGHIGESWQCPLAEGGTCDSVAAADPAVPDPKAAGTAVLAEPLWRVRGDELPETPPVTDCATACGEEFDPLRLAGAAVRRQRRRRERRSRRARRPDGGSGRAGNRERFDPR